jgi:hypothetical protein
MVQSNISASTTKLSQMHTYNFFFLTDEPNTYGDRPDRSLHLVGLSFFSVTRPIKQNVSKTRAHSVERALSVQAQDLSSRAFRRTASRRRSVGWTVEPAAEVSCYLLPPPTSCSIPSLALLDESCPR